MTQILHFFLEHKHSPYNDLDNLYKEAWGRLRCILYTEQTAITLLDHHWSLIQYIEWMVDSLIALYDPLTIGPYSPFPHESLAACLQRIYNTEHPSEDEDAIYDQLYHYRSQHTLPFALRGTPIPEIVLGINHQQGDISLATYDSSWYYTFDLQRSMHYWLIEFERFLEQWHSHIGEHPSSIDTYQHLTTNLHLVKTTLYTMSIM